MSLLILFRSAFVLDSKNGAAVSHVLIKQKNTFRLTDFGSDFSVIILKLYHRNNFEENCPFKKNLVILISKMQPAFLSNLFFLFVFKFLFITTYFLNSAARKLILQRD